jgi:2-polyprenyl-3-methyl-5-hydroxy-6-metoxy-1,4-benzoquinol methylase
MVESEMAGICDRSRPYFEIANPEIPAILSSLPRGLRVLDVGCGSGVHGEELARTYGHVVTGVDLSAPSVAKATSRLASAYVADVTVPEEYPFARSQSFDVILFSDLLEHLGDPESVLRRHLSLLSPGGHILLSIPNVAIWNVRLGLLFGRFRYTDTGTLDRTHMRFFTQTTARELLEGQGLTVVKSRISPGIARPFVPLVKKFYGKQKEGDSESIMQSGPYRAYLKTVYPIERAVATVVPGLLAFQFVLLARLTASVRALPGRAA